MERSRGANLASLEPETVQTSSPSPARKRVVAWSLTGALSLVAVATLVPTSPTTTGGSPDTSFWCLTCGDYALADAVANVVLFVPLGWAIAHTGMRGSVRLATIVATTVVVELLQYTVVPGRAASLSDILTNTMGGVAGLWLASRRWGIAESGELVPGATALYAVLLGAGLGVGEATQAVPLPRALRWTAGTMDAREYVPFTGSLRAVRMGETPIALYAWHNVPVGEPVDITVDLVSGRPDTGVAQVAIAWLRNRRGWMWLEQRQRDLHVHLASASDGYRLRGHSEWLRDAMPAVPGEPVAVRIVVRRRSYRIVVATPAGQVVRAETISLGSGWRLLAPFHRDGERWAALLTGCWMAVLLAPLGYLAYGRSRATTLTVAGGTGASLALLPFVLGGAGLPLSGWCGAAGGFLVGFVLASPSSTLRERE